MGPQGARDNAAFMLYENSFLEGLWKLNPDWATSSVGYHKYDSLLFVPDDKLRDKMLNFAKVQIDSLSRFEVTTLSDANKIDYHVMQNQMELIEWEIQQLSDHTNGIPSSHNIISTFAYILNEHYAPLALSVCVIFTRKWPNIPGFTIKRPKNR